MDAGEGGHHVPRYTPHTNTHTQTPTHKHPLTMVFRLGEFACRSFGVRGQGGKVALKAQCIGHRVERGTEKASICPAQAPAPAQGSPRPAHNAGVARLASPPPRPTPKAGIATP
jgi:hypothetical protein